MTAPNGREPGRARAAAARKPVPGWLIAVAVGVTGLVTVWIIMKKNPGLWEAETAAAPLRVVHATSPAIAVTEQYQKVAGARPIPPIQAGAANPHGDLGPCAHCHTVLGTTGAPVPALHAYARMPHEYPGGLCSDCHATLPAAAPALAGGAGRVVAGGGGAARPKVTEAEWMGMEVAPLTPLTREQYGIPNGIDGVVVTEVEGRARAAKLQAGDVIVALDATPITDPAGFAAATRDGRADRGTVHVFRGGQVLQAAFESQPPLAAPAPAPATVAPAPGSAGGDVPAQPIRVPVPMAAQPMQVPPATAQSIQPAPMLAQPLPGAGPAARAEPREREAKRRQF